MADATARRRRRGEDRSASLRIRVSAAERRALKARADARGVTMARLLVDAAMERPLPAPQARSRVEGAGELGAALDRLREQLVRVGNNVNQLAHAANIAGDLVGRGRLEDALGELREGLHELRLVLVRFPAR